MYTVQRGIGYRHVTSATARALAIEMHKYVSRAADAAVIFSHAAAESDAAVTRRLHQDDLVL